MAIYDYFEQEIPWETLGNHRRSEYHYTVSKATFDQERNVLNIYLTMNFVMPCEALDTVAESISDDFTVFPTTPAVRIHCFYENLILTDEELWNGSLPSMLRDVKGPYMPMLQGCEWEKSLIREGGVVTVPTVSQMVADCLNENMAPRMADYWEDRFKRPLSVRFAASKADADAISAENAKRAQEEIEAIARHTLEQANAPKPEVPAQAKAKAAPQGSTGGTPWSSGRSKRSPRSNLKKFIPADGDAFMGKLLQEPTFEIASLAEDSGPCILQGEVLRMDGKETKSGNVIVQIVLVDKTGAIGLKFFALPEKWHELEGLIKPGMTLLAAGTPEYDTYEKALTVRTTDLSLGHKTQRQDKAEQKRVELHLHTKMSQLDGLNDTKDVLKLVADWGHKACAITDHGVVMAFPDAMHAVEDKKHWKYPDFKVLYGMEGYLLPDDNGETFVHKEDYKGHQTYHIILLAQNQKGLFNLYKLVSESHLEHFYRKPLLLRSSIEKYREGLIIGAACEAGEFYRALRNGADEERLLQIARFYDYLEIQPLINNAFMVRDGIVAGEEDLRNLNRRIVEIGKKAGKPVCATCDAHYTEPEEALYRRIIMAGNGYKDAEAGEGLYLRTTDEMLEEFAYLGEETAFEVVVTNTNAIADRIESIRPVPKENFPPKIDNAEETLRRLCYGKARELYGDPLPQLIEERLRAELSYVIDKGYAVMYISAQMLVQKSLSDGYLVGSRGSVGSSFAATMAGITEVNPLPPHYLCTNPACKHAEFDFSGAYDCGVDMPDAVCPLCGSPTQKLGYNIPFETFLGIAGADKEPDIDLNFAGEYQPMAHRYVGEIFGEENVFRAGTMSGLQDKTAFGYVKKYFEEKGQIPSKWDVENLAAKCTGVRRTSGQHPGGMVIVPRGHRIEEFCPVQHPPNDDTIVTTHFEYHAIDKNLLKLDILGHEVPSIIRLLQDLTGRDPLTVPIGDPRVMSIFLSPQELGITEEGYPFRHGTFGVPEFGTAYTRQMLDDIQPKHFSDLVRIAGFSHGTDVWLGNAQELIRSGTATIDQVVGARDDIMNYLIAQGMPGPEAFRIMEQVRRGRGVTEEESARMKEFNVPDWYIESCRKIKYMFPKAHSVAYTLMSYRIAYYKVYYPQAFYAATFSSRVDDFNASVILQGIPAIDRRIKEIKAKGRDATPLEEHENTVLELAWEMLARGYEFLPVSLDASRASKFNVEDGKVRISFQALQGLGATAAKAIEEARKDGPFRSVEDLQARAKGVSSALVETLRQAGALEGIPETDQLYLF